MLGRVAACTWDTYEEFGIDVNPGKPVSQAGLHHTLFRPAKCFVLTSVPLMPLPPTHTHPPQSNVIAYSMLGMEAFRY